MRTKKIKSNFRCEANVTWLRSVIRAEVSLCLLVWTFQKNLPILRIPCFWNGLDVKPFLWLQMNTFPLSAPNRAKGLMGTAWVQRSRCSCRKIHFVFVSTRRRWRPAELRLLRPDWSVLDSVSDQSRSSSEQNWPGISSGRSENQRKLCK